uniref:Uncharacterized protein n=1 Tax=Cacopsylla melanoneura TaxID=428564 RepID=A0A8D9F7A3_9HEMI
MSLHIDSLMHISSCSMNFKSLALESGMIKKEDLRNLAIRMSHALQTNKPGNLQHFLWKKRCLHRKKMQYTYTYLPTYYLLLMNLYYYIIVLPTYSSTTCLSYISINFKIQKQVDKIHSKNDCT